MIKSKDLSALKDRFRKLLREELNLARFKEDEDGDFRFHYERMPLKLVFDDDDPSFVWIANFGFYWFSGADPADVARADRCISEVNYRCKAVKLCRATEPDKDGDFPVTASISFIAEDVASQDDWTLQRYLGQIKTGCDLFCDLFRRDEPRAKPRPESAVVH